MQIFLAEHWSRRTVHMHEDPISRDQASHVTDHGFAKLECLQKLFGMMTVGDLTFDW